MASAIGTGYDYSASQYSPDGKIFQIEYARKAVENSSTAIGICLKNGVVLAVEKEITSKLYEKNTANRIYHIDKRIGMAVSGITADARQVRFYIINKIVAFARKECKSYRELYGSSMSLLALTHRVALLVHAYTTYSGFRPFGCRYKL
ncbi:hypothetical protein HZS_7460 [Henneguya salminicola]|nr:hypothetical protein HZS_7460 [Henneguya salminicola]